MKSNRQLMALMERWGWVDIGHGTDRSSGKAVDGRVMVWPPTGEQIVVRADPHQGNSAPTVNAILRRTGAGLRFWDGPAEGYVRPAMPIKRAKVSAGPLIHTPVIPPFTPTPQEEPMPIPAPIAPPAPAPILRAVTGVVHERGLYNRLYEVLRDAGKPITCADAARMMAGVSRQRAGQGLAYLAAVGAAQRIKTGVYVAAPKPMGTVEHHGHVDHQWPTSSFTLPATAPVAVSEPVAPTPAPPPVQPAAPQPAPAPVRLAPTATEDDLYAALDLLLPDGIRAAKLPLVIQWLDVTKRLLA